MSLSLLVIGFVLIVDGFINTKAQQCDFGEYVGNVEQPKGTPQTSFNYGKEYLALNYFVSCCGLLSTWVLHAGRAGNITLRVWRPVEQNNQFSLWAETNMSVNDLNSTISYMLLPEKTIPVIPGDVIGWETVNLDIVSHVNEVEETSGSKIFFQDITSATVRSLFSPGRAEKSNISYNIGAYLGRSSPPSFQNLPHRVRISVDENNGTVIFVAKVNIINELQRQMLTFSLTESYGAYFEINPSMGKVTVAKTLSVGEFRIILNVADACGETRSGLLIVDVVDIFGYMTGHKLRIENLPARIGVPEDTHGGSLIFTLMNSHLSKVGTPQFSFAEDQTNISSIVHLDIGTGELSLRQGLDHEMHVKYNLSFTVSNGNITSFPEVLLIDVIDVNEPPSFGVSHYTVRTNAKYAWQLFPEIHYNVTDPDVNDTLTYSFVDDGNSMQDWLFIDAATGRLQYQHEYDTSGNDMPEMFSIDIEVQDRGGLKDSSTLQIFIEQNSTNLRYTGRTFEIALEPENKDILVYVSKSSPVGTVVTQILTYDVDCSSNGLVQFSLSRSPGSDYFDILSDGTVYLKGLLSDTDEMFFNLHVNVDYSPAESNMITVYVIIVEDTVEINSTMLEFNRNESTRQTFHWIIGSVVFFNVVILIAVSYYQRCLEKRKLSTCTNLPSTYLTHLIHTQILTNDDVKTTKHNLCHQFPQIHTYAMDRNVVNCTLSLEPS